MKCMVCGREHPKDLHITGDTIWQWHLRHRLDTDDECEKEFLDWCDYVEGLEQ